MHHGIEVDILLGFSGRLRSNFGKGVGGRRFYSGVGEHFFSSRYTLAPTAKSMTTVRLVPARAIAVPIPSASAAGTALSVPPRIPTTSRARRLLSATPFAVLKVLHQIESWASCGTYGPTG